MWIPGYCTGCRRIRRVRVSPANVAMKRWIGECRECIDKENSRDPR